VPIDQVNWMRMRRKTKGQPFVQFGDIARTHAALKLLREFAPSTSSAPCSLPSESVLPYGGRHLAETSRIAQLAQFLDEGCRRGGTIADEGTARAAERDAALAGPI
jgi:hypothetical protein